MVGDGQTDRQAERLTDIAVFRSDMADENWHSIKSISVVEKITELKDNKL